MTLNLTEQQEVGTAWMMAVGRGIMACEMRVGKSAMLIRALRGLSELGDDPFPTLLAVPNTIKFTWLEEFANWDPEVVCVVLHGTAAQRRKQVERAAECVAAGERVAVIVNWEGLRTGSRLAGYGSVELSDKEKQEGPLNSIKWRTVVADEAHRAVSPKAKQSLALKYLMHGAERRYLLTGTPVVNDASDLFSLWHLIAPEEAPVRSTWIERYAVAGQGVYGWEVAGFRQETQQEMFEILEPRFMRRTLREMRPGMPDRLPLDVRRVGLEGKQERTYRDLKKDMLASLPTQGGGESLLVVTDPLVLVGRLGYAAAATPVLDFEGNIVELALPSVKMDVLLETLEEAPAEPLVVFCVSRKLAELAERTLEKAKVSYVSIHGGVDPALRAANIAKFQAGEAQVCICTAGAGAEGTTLHAASRTLHLQVPWSNAQFLQANARTDGREGGPPLETIVSIVAGTVEEGYLAAISGKDAILQEVLRDALR